MHTACTYMLNRYAVYKPSKREDDSVEKLGADNSFSLDNLAINSKYVYKFQLACEIGGAEMIVPVQHITVSTNCQRE